MLQAIKNDYILTINKTFVSSFLLQQRTEGTKWRYVRIKVDNEENLYVSIVDDDCSYSTLFSGILVYNSKGILQKILTVQSKKNPLASTGMAIYNTLLYVCDLNNHSVLVLDKKNGIYQTEWGTEGRLEGQFYCPLSIYIWDGLWYVGDYYSIQLFNSEGLCSQRIEEWENEKFDRIRGICMLQDHLCVSDGLSKRIRVFRPDMCGAV